MGIIRRLREGMDFEFGALAYDVPRKPLSTANTTATDAGHVYPVDTGGAAVTLTLASEMVAEGAFVRVTDEGGAAATNAITIETEGSETIDGATSQTIGSDYGSLTLYSDGTNWFTLSSTAGGGTL